MRGRALFVLAVLATALLATAPVMERPQEDVHDGPSGTPASTTTPRPAAALPIVEWADREPMRFGIDHGHAVATEADLGTMWIGAWNLRDGWLWPERNTRTLIDEGVTPAYQLYYWGDDLSPSCFASGCWSKLHGVHKDQEGWDALVARFTTMLEEQAKGARVIVFLESEFNRHAMRNHEQLDAALARQAEAIRAGYPQAKVYLGLGNWYPAAWGTWDRAAAASDGIGLQGIRGSTLDPIAAFADLYPDTLGGALVAQERFDRPIVIHDVAVSSYGGQEEAQADAIADFMGGLGPLKDAGVEMIVYRTWTDDETMDPNNAYGLAEQAWGLVRADGTPKPAADAWLQGMAAERADPS